MFALPLLVYGLGVAPKDAVVISLAVVAITAAFGAVGALRAGLVEWRAGMIFASLGILGAPLGLAIGKHSAEAFIILGFAVLALLVACVMWRNAVRRPEDAAVIRADIQAGAGESGPICRYSPEGKLRINTRCGAALCLAGFGTSILSGLFGVGGGFLIVPALTLVTHMRIHRAVATSLFVIAVVGMSGVGVELLHGRALPTRVTVSFVLGGMLGMGLGRLWAHRIAGAALQKLFAAVILVVASLMIVTNLTQ